MYSIDEVRRLTKMDKSLTGKGIRVVVLEGDASIRSANIYDKSYIESGTTEVIHSDKTGELIRQFKPDSEIFLLPNSSVKKVDGLSVVDWILANNIDFVTMSQSKSMLSLKDQERLAKEVFILTSAGNKDELGETLEPEGDRLWWQVGALKRNSHPYLISKYGEWQKFSWSSWKRDAVDGATLSEVDTRYGSYGGTSGASPLYTVLLMDYYEVYKNFFNKKPTIPMTVDFIDRQSSNLLLEDDDADLKIGYGFLILPEKYHFEELTFTFPIGSHESLNTAKSRKDNHTELIELRDKAVIIKGRTYVPIRQLGELLGFDADWDKDKREATFRKQQGDH